ncbi:LysR substrate-binding domain-containing protein [Sabulicella rubraurantiaca]|uniref:LysR substrate-binding domain-containing protein n=1 Tax=Sabulicella rubraurantiaca TaxID=2811429 RepID=UPI001A96F7AD|nr:LysR substrate-binding domain-containing protein [Sabulicella rubraurantiaca]
MELRHLRYVVALADELHFGRAAARLGISQPPLSQQLAMLERQLGVRLFDRDRRGVRLTSAGTLFVVEARMALRAAERARDVALQAERGEVGELRIGLFASAPLTRGVAGAISDFRAAYPGARLMLTEAPSHRQVRALAEGGLDLGFLRSPAKPLLPPGLEAIEAVREPLCVVVPARHALARHAGPVPVELLAGEPMVFFDRSFSASMYDQIHALCTAAGFTPNIVQEANANTMILGLVAAGLGVSILPAAQCAMRPDRVRVRPIAAKAAVTASWLAYRLDDSSLLARRFVELVRSRGISTELLPGKQGRPRRATS